MDYWPTSQRTVPVVLNGIPHLLQKSLGVFSWLFVVLDIRKLGQDAHTCCMASSCRIWLCARGSVCMTAPHCSAGYSPLKTSHLIIFHRFAERLFNIKGMLEARNYIRAKANRTGRGSVIRPLTIPSGFTNESWRCGASRRSPSALKENIYHYLRLHFNRNY